MSATGKVYSGLRILTPDRLKFAQRPITVEHECSRHTSSPYQFYFNLAADLDTTYRAVTCDRAWVIGVRITGADRGAENSRPMNSTATQKSIQQLVYAHLMVAQ